MITNVPGDASHSPTAGATSDIDASKIQYIGMVHERMAKGDVADRCVIGMVSLKSRTADGADCKKCSAQRMRK